MGLFGTSPSTYLKRARNTQLKAVDAARVERDKTAGIIQGQVDEYADASMAMFAPFLSQMGEGMDMVDMFSDPQRFQEAMDAFYANPQYKIMMEESNKALTRAQARSGDRFSGSQLAALAEEAIRQGDKQFGTFQDRQLQLAQIKMGAGEFAMKGTQGVRDTELQAEVGVTEMLDRSQDEVEKGRIRAEYLTGKAATAANTRMSLGSLAGLGIGAYAGAAFGPLGMLAGASIGGQAGGAAGGL